LAVILLIPSGNAASDELNLAIDNVGVGLGNSSHFTGLRFNWSDDDVSSINGFNFTLWKPRYNRHAVYNGIVISLAGNNGHEINGIYTTLGGNGSPDITGIALGLTGFGANDLTGGYLRADNFCGFGTGAVTRILDRQEGLTIGLFNFADTLEGVQIGLLNYAGNNPTGLKLLPIINANF
jgi:hypothetical protein